MNKNSLLITIALGALLWFSNASAGPGSAPPPLALDPGRSAFVNPSSALPGFSNTTMDVSIMRLGGFRSYNAFVFTTIIDYIGNDIISQNRLDNYEKGIETYWSGVRTVKDPLADVRNQDFLIMFDVEFRDANNGRSPDSNALIEINNDVCRSDVDTWCLRMENEQVSERQQQHLAAHEFGHLSLGLIDEYAEFAGLPHWGSQVEPSDRFGNVCIYKVLPLGIQLEAGAWCNDMMALGLDTRADRYWTQIEAYLLGNSNRPDLQFGYAPITSGIFDVPVERLPSDHHSSLNSVPEPGTLALVLAALGLMAAMARQPRPKAILVT